LIPCSDGVGEIIALGPGCSRFAVGDRVSPIFAQGWIGGEPSRSKVRPTTLGGPLDGTLTEMMVVDERGLVAVAEHLTDAEAACMPCAAVTAWSALAVYGDVKAGDSVLVQGSGGVSIFALQFAKALGAKVIATSSSDEKLERLRALGADETINYATTPKWGKRARELAGDEGVDMIVEVGGARTLEQSLRAVRIGGQVSLIGALSGNVSDLNLLPILMQHVRIQGILVGSREAFESMNRAVALHKLRPVIDQTRFSLEQSREAMEHMAAAKHFGKVTIAIA